MTPVVLDTNIVLDLFVFADTRQAALHQSLQAGNLLWLATSAMRDELVSVLSYPQIAKRLQASRQSFDQVVAQMDALAKIVDASPKAPYACKDPDDQIFIDLACQHKCLLLSKDKQILVMRKRLAKLGVTVTVALHD